ncbi:MAG TPA: hypothetical protein VNW28_00100 [Chthoniobacterales bacterium]|nr:hypothetical protein [Chthoniobacterales bacterium]
MLDEIDRGFVRLEPRPAFFAVDRAIVFHSEFPNNKGKRQALEDERRENDTKGKKQNVATTVDRRAVGEHERESKQ